MAQRLIIGINPNEFLMITARRNSLEVGWMCGLNAPLARHHIAQSPLLLGIHDGMSWQLDALRRFIRCFCPVDWQPLSPHQHYCSDKCRQRAWRERKKVDARTHVVTDPKTGRQALLLVPENDRAARVAILAYANEVKEMNPIMAEHLAGLVLDLNLETPMPKPSRVDEGMPAWLIEQSKVQIIESEEDNG